jgi:hypothetical protein
MVPADTPAPTLCNPRASTRSYAAAAKAPRSAVAAWRDAQQLGKVVRQKQARHRASLAAWPLEVSDSRRPRFNHFPRAPWQRPGAYVPTSRLGAVSDVDDTLLASSWRQDYLRARSALSHQIEPHLLVTPAKERVKELHSVDSPLQTQGASFDKLRMR